MVTFIKAKLLLISIGLVWLQRHSRQLQSVSSFDGTMGEVVENMRRKTNGL